MNKSEELCKLLEIEPEIEENYCISNYDDCPMSTQCCCPENCTKYDNFEKEHEVYPDLTKQSNFVKLLTIDFDIDLVLGIDNIEDNFIETLISLLPHMYEYDTKGLEAIKQQAQATKWDY